MSNMKWTFFNLWNESLEMKEERKMEPRERIWASELGGSMIDRYHKMKATPYSNPPNPRSQRKFEAGNFMEWIVGVVLKRAGILHEANSQEYLQYKYEGLLPVTGRLDFMAGGKPDYEKARDLVGRSNFPESITRATQHIIANFQKMYPDGLDNIILEIKSCGSFMFDIYERTGVGNPNHQLQAFHYLKAKEMPEAHIVYISKDDLRMLEIGIFNPSVTEEKYKKDIETITNYVNMDEEPPKEKELVFDPEFGRFSANWKVMYSNYLEMLYGYKNQMEFENIYRPMSEKFNRVLKRCCTGATMTKANLEIIEGAKLMYPNWDEIVELSKPFHQKDEPEQPEEAAT